MSKNISTTKEMTYGERLAIWQKGRGFCPYCGGDKVTLMRFNSSGIHYLCRDCGAENHFSRRRDLPEE